jgi:hypothetical protein
MGHNFSRQGSTRFSPYYMLYQKEPRLGDPQDIEAVVEQKSVEKAT